MEISEQTKKNITNSFLSTIADLSDKEYQRRVWIEGKEPEGNDFDETYITFGDCDTILENWEEFGLSIPQKLLLEKFTKIFLEFGDENDWPPFFINTPEWTHITEMAKQVLQAFNYKKQ